LGIEGMEKVDFFGNGLILDDKKLWNEEIEKE
jgi:hypothetical protein